MTKGRFKFFRMQVYFMPTLIALYKSPDNSRSTLYIDTVVVVGGSWNEKS